MKLTATFKSWFSASEIASHPATAHSDEKYSTDLPKNVEYSFWDLGSFVIVVMGEMLLMKWQRLSGGSPLALSI
jgi:hypothetical protein